MSTDVRWEHGSDFPLPDLHHPIDDRPSWLACAAYYHSGRAALSAILTEQGRRSGTGRIWIPAYYCEDVVPSVVAAGWNVLRYDCTPEDTDFSLGPLASIGDTVLIVNFFGLRGRLPACRDLPRKAVVIEDHTHDPASSCAQSSEADWCFASLRKTLPIPDGGVLWSPRELTLPPVDPRAIKHDLALNTRLAAMALKRAYLSGADVDKQLFRKMFIDSEEWLTDSAPGAISEWSRAYVNATPWAEWRQARRENHEALSQGLDELRCIKVLQPEQSSDVAPLALSLCFQDPSQRSAVRAALVARDVYPVVLWTLRGDAPPRAREFSECHLAVQCDQRYAASDMHRVATQIRIAVGA